MKAEEQITEGTRKRITHTQTDREREREKERKNEREIMTDREKKYRVQDRE